LSRTFDVAVIGAGMAGMAASLFARRAGLSCIQIGNGGGLLFASGLLDLFGVHPAKRCWDSPWDGLSALARDIPEHPLARVEPAAIRVAMETFVQALDEAGMPYFAPGDRNRWVLTSLGQAKPTCWIPRTMAASVLVREERLPCVIVDFRGLREFSARQVVAIAGWPGLRSVRVEFPLYEAVPELYAAHLARALEDASTRSLLLERLRPLLGDAKAVGVPAILGIERSMEVHSAFEEGLGVPVFEIPTMPTSVPGFRLKAALERAMAKAGVERLVQAKAVAVRFDPLGAEATVCLDDNMGEVVARSVVLATGRFFGKGLVAGRDGIREAVLGLPVHQPTGRAGWHDRDFLAPHPVNRAGLLVDEAFRPKDHNGLCVWPRLFAVGSILAHQDWVRERCGSALAVSTAWAAVQHIAGGRP